MVPRDRIVPPKTFEPRFFYTGFSSPVSIDSFASPLPVETTPSMGIV